MTLAYERERLEAVAGFGHDLDVWLSVEERTHALTFDGVVVHEQNADLGLRAVHLSHTPSPDRRRRLHPPPVWCFLR
jgi:hypothetical protein